MTLDEFKYLDPDYPYNGYEERRCFINLAWEAIYIHYYFNTDFFCHPYDVLEEREHPAFEVGEFTSYDMNGEFVKRGRECI